MDTDAKAYALLAVGVVAGVCLALAVAPVRDWLLDMLDDVTGWWLDLVDMVRRLVQWAGMLLLFGLAAWAVVALVLPRFVHQ